ncbi:MAG TPA: 5-oxoprolinase subunit PxpB [Candidatus Binatia bacterium]|nr:5-oxoprolinase subunit PxpB [Candidatus Binatia bacterium]
MIRPFGEAALLVELGGPDRAQALAASIRREPIAGVVGTVPGLESLLVDLDPLSADAARVPAALEERILRLADAPAAGRLRTIPVVYGGDHGPDLAEVASMAGLTEGEIVARHASAELRVLFGGFAPGFAYLGGVRDALDVPRLATPRTRTPAGSVALADGMSGIYPAELPGGWRVIGRTPITVFDAHRLPPAYLEPGDRVRFEPIDAVAWDRFGALPDDW